MHTPPVFRHAVAAGGFVALGMLGACTDSMPTSASNSAVAAVGTFALLAAADFVVPGADGGAFVHPIVANESGYLTTEFWDNPSDDGTNCNVGFWATHTLVGPCSNEAPGSFDNQGGYTTYWGNGSENRATSSFMFNGAYAYRVTLLGSYALEHSEMGWFTVSAGVYTFHPVAGWGTETIGTSAIIHPAEGANWGFYLKHAGHLGDISCGVDTDCSDAAGDMHSNDPPIQQFALFTNEGESMFLVGVENNEEETPTIGDDDFQDFILSVEPLGGMFVIGDVEDHAINDVVNFWGAQWWKNNVMSGLVSSGVASFKGYASTADGFCGGGWSTLPGNSPPPPAVIPDNVVIIVTSTVLKTGPIISGDIQQILMVHHDGSYGPNPGHAGSGPVIEVVCEQPD